jgi:hypothetical protein
MTLTIEIDAPTEAQLRADALEENTSLEEMAARWMRAAALSDQEWEEAEDAADNEAADAALEESDPSKWVYLDEVRPHPEQHRRAA